LRWPRLGPLLDSVRLGFPAIDLREARELRMLNPAMPGSTGSTGRMSFRQLAGKYRTEMI
jgi:hypothetical protein